MTSTPLSRAQDYLLRADLHRYADQASLVVDSIHGLMGSLGALPTLKNLDEIYTYRIPELSEDGSCSIIDALSPTPYDLTAVLGGRNEDTTRKLLLLTQLVLRAAAVSGADWLGIYQARALPQGGRALVKLAYFGRPSRAEFPLTAEFAKGSTNSTVGLEGSARVIDDVVAYTAEGGGFYVCDDAVNAEACLPIFSEAGDVIGIVDAEAEPRNFFTAERVATIAAVAMIAPAMMPG